MPDHKRADARRNYARILTVAQREVEAEGAAASLEQIARVAGVGSATVRRHFPTRHALLEAVSQSRITALAERAGELEQEPDSKAALLEWLQGVLGYCVTARGLAVALAYADPTLGPNHENACSAALERAAAPLVRRAIEEGQVAEHVTEEDLIASMVGIAMAVEQHTDSDVRAARLFRIVAAGLEKP